MKFRKFNMEAHIRNDPWNEDHSLKEVMKRYVAEGLRCKEILDYLRGDFFSIHMEF